MAGEGQDEGVRCFSRADGMGSLILFCSNVTSRHKAIINIDSQGDRVFGLALGGLTHRHQRGEARRRRAAKLEQETHTSSGHAVR